jgi:hypothetical protein
MTSIPSLKWTVHLPLMPAPAFAGVVGYLKVCYLCTNNFNSLGVTDGPVFLIENTGGSPITNGVFTLGGDSFHVGTIAASGSFMIEPGVTSDGDARVQFTGKIGALIVDSGPLTNLYQCFQIGLCRRRIGPGAPHRQGKLHVDILAGGLGTSLPA